MSLFRTDLSFSLTILSFFILAGNIHGDWTSVAKKCLFRTVLARVSAPPPPPTDTVHAHIQATQEDYASYLCKTYLKLYFFVQVLTVAVCPFFVFADQILRDGTHL